MADEVAANQKSIQANQKTILENQHEIIKKPEKAGFDPRESRRDHLVVEEEVVTGGSVGLYASTQFPTDNWNSSDKLRSPEVGPLIAQSASLDGWRTDDAVLIWAASDATEWKIRFSKFHLTVTPV
jgi:hypothetical protein